MKIKVVHYEEEMAILQEELNQARAQQQNATGEWGFWGGLTREEDVKAKIKELNKRFNVA